MFLQKISFFKYLHIISNDDNIEKWGKTITQAKKKFSIIKLIYEIKDEKKINIFHPNFVKNNRDICKMTINNKIHLLTDKYLINDDKIKYLKIRLIIPNDIKINLSFMFYKCTSLKKFSLKLKKINQKKN